MLINVHAPLNTGIKPPLAQTLQTVEYMQSLMLRSIKGLISAGKSALQNISVWSNFQERGSLSAVIRIQTG